MSTYKFLTLLSLLTIASCNGKVASKTKRNKVNQNSSAVDTDTKKNKDTAVGQEDGAEDDKSAQKSADSNSGTVNTVNDDEIPDTKTEMENAEVPKPPPVEIKPPVDPKAQPVLHGLKSEEKCYAFTKNPADCSQFCTVVVCGVEAGAYDGDLDGTRPIFRFKKKGDTYCGGTGQPVKVEVACRKPNQSQTFEFINPGAPPSGAASPGSKFRWEKDPWGKNGMTWKSSGDGGRPLVIILSKDFGDDLP